MSLGARGVPSPTPTLGAATEVAPVCNTARHAFPRRPTPYSMRGSGDRCCSCRRCCGLIHSFDQHYLHCDGVHCDGHVDRRGGRVRFSSRDVGAYLGDLRGQPRSSFRQGRSAPDARCGRVCEITRERGSTELTAHTPGEITSTSPSRQNQTRLSKVPRWRTRLIFL